ncbi:hypothetical protein VSDG_01391 [Cytospora chrysosperma]|uniref:Uncharacterized protein n=1 Tax=Cytospora chrysosperma TaxID=252740 RepID=A0A423WIR7_CYTCH|nr:hypothetical protein VSDG_01391 [Valsa sordida]
MSQNNTNDTTPGPEPGTQYCSSGSSNETVGFLVASTLHMMGYPAHNTPNSDAPANSAPNATSDFDQSYIDRSGASGSSS